MLHLIHINFYYAVGGAKILKACEFDAASVVRYLNAAELYAIDRH